MSSSEGSGMQDGLRNNGLYDTKNFQTISRGFFRLPREIRDQVYEDTLDSSALPPPSIRKIRDKNPVIRDEGTPGLIYNYHGRNKTPPISCAGLLCSNHQISEEMGEVLMRRNMKTEEGVQYKLYLMACHKSLLPTWLSLPAPLKYLRTLQVDLQLSNHRSFQWVGSVGTLAELSLQLLLRFFRCGPRLSDGLDDLPQQERLRNRMPYLDVLTIRIVPTLAGNMERNKSSREGSHPAVTDLMTFDFLGSYLLVIAQSYLFRGRIRTIRLRCCESIREYTVQPQLTL